VHKQRKDDEIYEVKYKSVQEMQRSQNLKNQVTDTNQQENEDDEANEYSSISPDKFA
jgi:hypothetical protein